MEIEIVTTKSLFRPRWWQFRRRYRVWRWRRERVRELKKMTKEQQDVMFDIREAIERSFLLGDDRKDS